MIDGLKKDAWEHGEVIHDYQKKSIRNLDVLKTLQNAQINRLDTQIKALEEMIKNKKELIIGGVYQPEQMKMSIRGIKTVNLRLKNRKS